MIPKECKRLAEVDFPIAVVSKHAVAENAVRHGHPKTLHLWWARRPLAACRAMLLGLLLPDPCDEQCPEDFKQNARELLPRVQGHAGIPYPHFMTYFVSSVEFISGCLLIIGLLSSLCCAALIVQMIVATTTVQLATIPKGLSFLDWLDNFLYLPETMYIVILIWLICSGPGRVSVDDRIATRWGIRMDKAGKNKLH